MSVLEIILYIAIGVGCLILAIKVWKKAYKIRQEKKKGTYKPDQEDENE